MIPKKKRTKSFYDKAESYWDFTRNMSEEQIIEFVNKTKNMDLDEIIQYVQKRKASDYYSKEEKKKGLTKK